MKKKYGSFAALVLFFFAFTLASCGGGGDEPAAIPWITKQIGTTANDFGNGIVVDANGNVYVAGSTDSGLDGNASAGGRDAFVVKYDATGTRQWTRQLGSSVTDESTGIAADANGNVYVTGYTAGGLDGNTSAGGYDLFVVKFTSAGIKQWTRQLGSISYDAGQGITVDANGNAYVTGKTFGSLDGNKSAGGYDLFVVKYTSEGIKQWTKQLGSAVDDVGQGITVDANGNVYVTGYTAGGLDGNTSAGGYDLFVAKYTSEGIKEWTKQLGSGVYDAGECIAVDRNGNVYAAGATLGDLGGISAGIYDLFVVKYNSAGTVLWARQLGTAVTDAVYGIAADANANVYVAGNTNGGLDGNTNAGDFDLCVIKYDSAGTKQWTRQIGTARSDYAIGIAADANGNSFATGATYGNLDGNTNADQTGSTADIFIVKYSSGGVKQ